MFFKVGDFSSEGAETIPGGLIRVRVRVQALVMPVLDSVKEWELSIREDPEYFVLACLILCVEEQIVQ